MWVGCREGTKRGQVKTGGRKLNIREQRRKIGWKDETEETGNMKTEEGREGE